MQSSTQDEPAFCGLASLAMVLNALAVDPKRAWKGAWRWFHEALLDCCRPLEDIKRDGINLDQARVQASNPKICTLNAKLGHAFQERETEQPASHLMVGDCSSDSAPRWVCLTVGVVLWTAKLPPPV